MAITCTSGGTPHTHNTVQEVRACYMGGNSSPVRPPAPSAPVASSLSIPGMASPKQVRFLSDLGIPERAARHLDKHHAHLLIDELLAEQRGTPVSAPTPPQPTIHTARQSEPEDPRVQMIKAILVSIPNGYFAVDQGTEPTWGDTGKYDFLRISRPKSGKYKDAIKIQSQHGDRLENRAILWPSGHLSVFDRRVLDPLMTMMADHKTCLTTYGQVIGRCCRCHKQLTDDRSRHYGIGPECEQIFPWVIEEVDAANSMGA